MLIGISSAYRKAGLIYDKFRKYYGRDDANVLVIRATFPCSRPVSLTTLRYSHESAPSDTGKACA
jgi:hypothetical protein